MAKKIKSISLVKRTIPVFVVGGAFLGANYCVYTLTNCCPTGSGWSGSGSGSGSYIYISGCSHPYPSTIYGTWTTGTGSCGCFTGSFPLTWDPSQGKWVGTFNGCNPPAPVIVKVTPPPNMAGQWGLELESTMYSFMTAYSYAVSCGLLFNSSSISVSGSCFGGTQISFSE